MYKLILFFVIRKYYNLLYIYDKLTNLFLDSDSKNESVNLKMDLVQDPFFEWLAGLVDGDGYFNLSKKGIARLQITMDIRDKKALYEIKHKLGGYYYSYK